MTDKEIQFEYEFMPCSQCGQTISKDSVDKRKSRGLDQIDVCRDCRDVKTYLDNEKRKIKRWIHPVLGLIECVIFDGELNDDWLPVDDEGELFRPGERICGFKDCVKKMHIIAPEVKTVSPIDLILGMYEMQQYNKRVRTNNE